MESSSLWLKNQKKSMKNISQTEFLKDTCEKYKFNPHRRIFQIMSDIRYLFCPGSLSFGSATSKYTKRYQSVNGDWVNSQHYAEIFPENAKINVVQFSEINSETVDNESINGWVQSMVLKIYQSVGSNNMIGLTTDEFQIQLHKYNLGQKSDIEMIKKEYQSIVQNEPDSKIVVLGSSRGAAAIFSWLATSTREETKNIKSAILEAVPSSVNLVLDHCNGIHFAVLKICSMMLPLISEYSPDGYHPIDLVDSLPRDIPMLLVTSEADKIVPSQSVVELFIQLKKSNYNNVKLLVLQNSDHSNYTTQDKNDTDQYIQESEKYISLKF